MLYDILTNLGPILNQGTCAPPFCNSSSVSIPATNPVTLTLPVVFPASAAGRALSGLDYHLQQPHMLQYNLTVERQLPANMALTLAYAGSRGINLMQFNEGNPTVPQGTPSGQRTCLALTPPPAIPNGPKCWNGNEPRINPNFDTFALKTASGDSWYDSLQFGLLKRLSKGLQFQSSYTWSKTIDTNQGTNGGDSITSQQFLADPWDERRERGVAYFDITQNWRFNAIYRIPELAGAGSAMGKLRNGWSASGILTLQTGFPFTVELQTNRSRSKVAGGGNPSSQTTSTDRPDLVAGRNNSNITNGTTAGCPGVAAGQKLATQNLWFDPCAFTLQPAGFLGTAGRNILRGPGIANLDFSLTKDTPLHFLGEGGKLEFRAEVFNLLNHANLATPALGGSSSNPAGIIFAARADGETPLGSVGRISFTSTASRQIQLSLRILF